MSLDFTDIIKQAGFIPQMLALAFKRMNRSLANEVHARYCCGKCVLLARAQGNECRMAITALGEVTFGRICNMQAAVKSHGSTELERQFYASQNHSTHSHIHDGYRILLSFMLEICWKPQS